MATSPKDRLPTFNSDADLERKYAELRRSIAEGTAEMWTTEEEIRQHRKSETQRDK